MSILLQSIAYVHPDRELLFQHINLSITKGAKAALVGNNGTGKSTLLQIIAGRLQPSEGAIVLPEPPYYVPQHTGQYDQYTVAEALGIAGKLQALQAILNGDTSIDNFNALNEDWDMEEKVKAAFDHWALQHISATQRMQTLSGGEKTKVFLAGIAIHQPGIILLDEPSNHLDAESRQGLYDLITNSKATMLIVSHDSTLLDLLDTTIELSADGVDVYGGNYSFYKQQKEEKQAALQAQVSEKERSLRQAQRTAREIAGMRQKQESRGIKEGRKQNLPAILIGRRKNKAEQSTAKLKDLHSEKIEGIKEDLQQVKQQVEDYEALRMQLTTSDLHKGKILVDAKDINISYGKLALWPAPLTFQLRSGDRLRIEGNNGAGKTSLLRIITGALQPTAGEIVRADFQYLYIDQEYSIIDNALTVFEQAQTFNHRHLEEHEVKIMLHRHQFTKDSWDKKCSALSGGEKMKLLLCCIAVSSTAPDLLILDEPTNNLDVHSQEVLTRAVKGYNGTLLIISHDQHFINEVQANTSLKLETRLSGEIKKNED